MSIRIPKKINQDFFKEWSFDMAYVLGFIVADGCISLGKGRQKNPYTITITSKDLEHLYNIKKVLGSEYKISKKFGSAGTPAYQIQFRNLKVASDLIKIGVYPRKTYHLDPIKVPEKYFADFVRGFFDGDGSVYIYDVNSVKQIKSSFVSTSFDFIKDFNTQLCKALSIPEKSIHKTSTRGIHKMIQYNNCFYIDDSKKLAEFMYGNNPLLYLERKKEIFDEWQEVKDKTKRKNFIKKNYPSKIGWRLSEGFKVT